MVTQEELEQPQQQPELLAGFAAQCMRDSKRLALYSPDGVRSLASFAYHRTTEVDVACKEAKSDAGECYSGEERARQSVALKFGDFVDFYCASHTGTYHWLKDVDDLEFYLCQCPIAVYRPDATCASAALPCVMDDFVVPETLPFHARALSLVNLWMAVRASRTSLHYDAYANVLVVLHGRKTVTLFAPSESGNLYAYPVHSASANHSRVDARSPDAAAHPRFARAASQRFVVNTGDALVIPEGWWHQVDTDAFTIAVNFWFDGLQKQLAQMPPTTVPYCARVLLQELIKRESAHHLESLCASAAVEGRQCESGLSHTPEADRALQQVAAALRQEDRERAMLQVAHDDLVFRVVQLRLATHYSSDWRALLESASDDLVALLTECWERELPRDADSMDVCTIDRAVDAASSSREQQQQQFMETLLGVFADGGERIRAQLIEKKSAFTQKICAKVMLDTFGLSVQ